MNTITTKKIIALLLTTIMLMANFGDLKIFAAEEQQQQTSENTEKKYVDRSEIYITVFGERFYQEEYRKFMWSIYDSYGFDVTLAFMNEILPSPHNYEWLKGNVDFYVNAIFNLMWLQKNDNLTTKNKYSIYGQSTLD